jgi:hypothetical protein
VAGESPRRTRWLSKWPCDRAQKDSVVDHSILEESIDTAGVRNTVEGKTWKGATLEALAAVRALLLRRGGVEDTDLKNPHEVWRVRIERCVFTGYRSGTIYANGGDIPELPFLYESISNVIGEK